LYCRFWTQSDVADQQDNEVFKDIIMYDVSCGHQMYNFGINLHQCSMKSIQLPAERIACEKPRIGKTAYSAQQLDILISFYLWY
jgi:hypothetical protein